VKIVGILELLSLLNDLNAKESSLCLLNEFGAERYRLLVAVERLIILAGVEKL